MSNPDVDNELSEHIQAWNPMQEDYANSQFNQYISGPGADLDPSLQTAPQAKERKPANQQQETNQSPPQQLQRNDGGSASSAIPNVNVIVPYLIFRNVPKGMSKNALYNLCSRHGTVTDVRDSTKNDYFFVDLKTVADMESVLRALKENTYGFDVRVGKNLAKKSNENTPGGNGTFPASNEFFPSAQPTTNTIDMESRKYLVSGKQLPRPFIKSNPIIGHKQYADPKNTLLQRNDPQRHFLIEHDAHELERAGLHKPNAALHANTKYQFRTGRAYIKMPDKMRKFVEQKHQESNGVHDAQLNSYVFKTPNATKPDKIGLCSECKRPCDLLCARCSSYFCGLECEQKAWPTHRYVCGKPKHLQKSPPTNNDSSSSSTHTTKTKLKMPTPPKPVKIYNVPRSGNLVTLTAITKTNLVFIRSKTYDDNMQFFKTISEIQAAAKSLKPLQEMPNIGQLVIAQFEGQFNRAIVLKTSDSKGIQINCIDYGNVDVKPLGDLYAAPEHFINLPRFAIPVLLKGVQDCCMTDNVRKFMYSYLDIDLLVKYRNKSDFNAINNMQSVDLIDEATNQNFNKMIVELCKPVEPNEADKVLYRDYLTQKLLPAGENIELIVMDNSLLNTGCITCTTFEYAEEIEKFSEELHQYGVSLEEHAYAPRVDELCIAKYSNDQKWYRGRCLEIVGDGHPTIIFFDYGNIEMVSVKNIRRYPPQFTYPIYTSDCEIAGLPETCNDALVAKLEELVPHGSRLCCDRVKIYEEDYFHSITLEKVIKQLQTAGLLERKSET